MGSVSVPYYSNPPPSLTGQSILDPFRNSKNRRCMEKFVNQAWGGGPVTAGLFMRTRLSQEAACRILPIRRERQLI